MSYLRIATHPSIFERPLTPAQAVGSIDAFLSLPHCRAIGDKVDHLPRAAFTLFCHYADRNQLIGLNEDGDPVTIVSFAVIETSGDHESSLAIDRSRTR